MSGFRFYLAFVVAFCAVPLTLGCDSQATAAKKRIEPVYDKETGKLQLLKYDAHGDGKVDTWSYMDGARIVRIEIDKDGDGKIDRWEYYGPDQKLQKIGVSRANDGKPDTWSYLGPDGSVARIEIATPKTGKVTRTEYYEHSMLVRAEEDSDGDGKIDKWETYDGDHLATVAFDTTHRGFPDRRLIYGPGGTASVETDPAGTGKFAPASNTKSARR
jgi:hypothetical protein